MDFETQLNYQTFPHKTEKGRIKATIANLKHLLNEYGIDCEYNEILKKQRIFIDVDNADLAETATYAQIKSLLALNDVPLSTIELLPSVLAQKTVNPPLDWIKAQYAEHSKRKKERLYISQLCATIHTVDYLDSGRALLDIDTGVYKSTALLTWLVQCVAALDGAKSSPRTDKIAKYELVLVLQGEQGIGKTTWLNSLVPKEFSEYFKSGMHLDIADKDSVKKCISSWICELGELDSTFRKSDIARLKAFLSNESDEIRLPYDKVSSSFKRRTSFCASVNPKEFLTDTTGSRRFLPLETKKCIRHNIDLGGLWAEIYSFYINGMGWWCDKELEQMLIQRHDIHAEKHVIDELIEQNFRIDEPIKRIDANLHFEHLTTTQILQFCEIKIPNKEQIKQAKTYLEKNHFESKVVQGKRGYWIAQRPTCYE